MTRRRSSSASTAPQARPRPARGGIALRIGGIELTTPSQARSRARRRRHRFRPVRRLLGTVLALALLAAAGFTGLMLIIPSVGNAPALVQALDRAHHAAYPGPPVPGQFEAALVATEDQGFYTQASLDPTPMARVLIGHLAGGSDQGGQTIAEQLAKILYVQQRSGLLAEEEQVLLGIKLAYTYSRAQVLRLYADSGYFGHGFYGLGAASCGYFAEPPAGLSWGQTAMLVALVQAPSANDPFAHYPSARAGEAAVLGRLVSTGKLGRREATLAYAEPLHLAAQPGRARC